MVLDSLQLYREASFWRLRSLQRAIEEEKVFLVITHLIMELVASERHKAVSCESGMVEKVPFVSV